MYFTSLEATLKSRMAASKYFNTLFKTIKQARSPVVGLHNGRKLKHLAGYKKKKKKDRQTEKKLDLEKNIPFNLWFYLLEAEGGDITRYKMSIKMNPQRDSI